LQRCRHNCNEIRQITGLSAVRQGQKEHKWISMSKIVKNIIPDYVFRATEDKIYKTRRFPNRVMPTNKKNNSLYTDTN